MKTVDSFIDYLSKLETPDSMSLNLYYGKSKEAEVKRENLRYYLNEMQRLNPQSLFIGEAPGRLGCFLTGVPFTDEYTIANNPFFKGKYRLLSKESPHRESSASIIWGCLNKIPINKYPLMWNIYPFHPSNVDFMHKTSKERINRTPNGKECNLGKEILKELLELYKIEQFYAIGCIPRNTLKPIYNNIEYLRHPSHCGANIFREQFYNIHNIK